MPRKSINVFLLVSFFLCHSFDGGFVCFHFMVDRMGQLNLKNSSERYQLHQEEIWMKNCIVSVFFLFLSYLYLFFFSFYSFLLSFSFFVLPYAQQHISHLQIPKFHIDERFIAFLCCSILCVCLLRTKLSHKIHVQRKMFGIYNFSVLQLNLLLCTLYSKLPFLSMLP